MYQNIINSGAINNLNFGPAAFWKQKSIYLLIFWLSVIADMFIIYRLSEEEENSIKSSRLNIMKRPRSKIYRIIGTN